MISRPHIGTKILGTTSKGYIESHESHPFSSQNAMKDHAGGSFSLLLEKLSTTDFLSSCRLT